MTDLSQWRAKSRYWKYSGLFLLLAGAATPFLSGAEEPYEVAVAMVVLVIPLVVWLWRVAAWEEESHLVFRNFFGTKRIPWHTIDKLELTDDFWAHDWAYMAVRHDGGRTYIKAMIAIRFGEQRLIEEVRDLALRRHLKVDEESIALHRQSASKPEAERKHRSGTTVRQRHSCNDRQHRFELRKRDVRPVVISGR